MAECHRLLPCATGSAQGRNQRKQQDVSILSPAPPQLERLRHLAMGCSSSAEPVPALGVPWHCRAAWHGAHATLPTTPEFPAGHAIAKPRGSKTGLVKGREYPRYYKNATSKDPKIEVMGKKQTIPEALCFCSSAKKLKFARVEVGG